MMAHMPKVVKAFSIGSNVASFDHLVGGVEW